MYISSIENREILESLKDFCKVRNLGTALENSAEPSPRARFVMDLCERVGITYEIDYFVSGGCHYHNIVLRGNSTRMVIAHHDIVNIESENANDNSASVINAILLNSYKMVIINNDCFQISSTTIKKYVLNDSNQ